MTDRLGKSAGVTMQEQPASPQRICVVGDDDENRLFNAEALNHFGYHMDDDGAAARALTRRNRYDLLIADN